MKKIVGMLLIGFVFVLALVGCGNEKSDATKRGSRKPRARC